MSSHGKVKLTSSEMAALWVSYQNQSLGWCFLRYFLEKAEDERIRSVMQFALNKCVVNFDRLCKVYAEEAMPVPIGFTEEDVEVCAP